MSLGDLGISTVNGGAIGVKNAIINGNFAVNQRAVSGTVTLAAGVYGHDRFKAGASGCTYTFATANNITTLTISAGSLIQVIEGNNLFTGTYTLSWVGTAQGKIGGGSYASSGVTGTPAGGSNLNIEFNTGTLSLVQFEPGAIATPFERRPFGDELALCQRYFFCVGGDFYGNINFQQFANGSINSATNVSVVHQFPTVMRSAPTLSVTNVSNFRIGSAGVAFTPSAIALDIGSPVNGTVTYTSSGMTAGRACTIFQQATSLAALNFSAEL
jgi:hypothetical protein